MLPTSYELAGGGSGLFVETGRVGSYTVPLNTTVGDWTVKRLHAGPTDATFVSAGAGGTVYVPAIEARAGSITLTGTIANASANTVGVGIEPTFSGAGSAPIGMLLIPTFAPSATIAAAIGGSYAVQAAPGAAVTITVMRGLQLRTDYTNTAGAVTTGVAGYIASPIVSGALKPGTQNGLQIANMGISGTTTSNALLIEAQSGSTTNIAIRSQGGENRFAGAVTIGADAAATSGYTWDQQAGRWRLGSSITLSGSLDAAMLIAPTLTNGSALEAQVHVGGTMNGAGDEPIALLIRPFFSPSSAITHAYGASLAGIHNGGTINNDLVGFRPIVGSFSNTGSVTSLKGIRVDTPVYTGSVRATNQYGIDIQNQGVSGATNAYGLFIRQQSGATNNWEVGIDSGAIDTVSAAGTYYGRVKVAVPGVGTKYWHLFN